MIGTAASEKLKRSKKFREWEPARYKSAGFAAEHHFEPNELAKLWGVSAETIRNVFRDEPGVLRIAHPNGGKRKYVSMRVPESVAERVHKRLSAIPL